MMAALFIGGIAAIIALREWKLRANKKTHKSRKQQKPTIHHAVRKHAHIVPHALSMLIVVAHASELTRVVEHVDWQHTLAALALLGVWTMSGSAAPEA